MLGFRDLHEDTKRYKEIGKDTDIEIQVKTDMHIEQEQGVTDHWGGTRGGQSDCRGGEGAMETASD